MFSSSNSLFFVLCGCSILFHLTEAISDVLFIFLFFFFFFWKVLQKQVCNLNQRILSSSDVPGKHKVPGMRGDEDLAYIWISYCCVLNGRSQRAGAGVWGREGLLAASGLWVEFFVCVLCRKGVFLWGKRPACLILGRPDLLMGSDGEILGPCPALTGCWLWGCFWSVSLGL